MQAQLGGEQAEPRGTSSSFTSSTFVLWHLKLRGTCMWSCWSHDLAVTWAMKLLQALYWSQARRPFLKLRIGYVLGVCLTVGLMLRRASCPCKEDCPLALSLPLHYMSVLWSRSPVRSASPPVLHQNKYSHFFPSAGWADLTRGRGGHAAGAEALRAGGSEQAHPFHSPSEGAISVTAHHYWRVGWLGSAILWIFLHEELWTVLKEKSSEAEPRTGVGAGLPSPWNICSVIFCCLCLRWGQRWAAPLAAVSLLQCRVERKESPRGAVLCHAGLCPLAAVDVCRRGVFEGTASIGCLFH